jgi:hypothetical protein
MTDIRNWLLSICLVLLIRQVWVIFWPVVKVAAHRFWSRKR